MLGWVGLACIFSVVRAAFTMINEWAKLPGSVMLVWRGFWPFVFMTPAVWAIDMPTNPKFYMFVFCNAMFAAVMDARNFESASRFGGGVTLRIQPISLIFVFLIWLVISAEERSAMLSHPYHLAGILGCLSLGAWALSRLRHCTLSKQALIYLLPVLCVAPFVDIFNKLSMDSVGSFEAVLTYIWFQSGLMAVWGILYLKWKQKSFAYAVGHIDRKQVYAGLAIGAILIGGGMTKNSAMMLSPNPAYITAIAMLAPVWATLLYKVLGKKEEANVAMGLLFVGCVIMMLFIASFIHSG